MVDDLVGIDWKRCCGDGGVDVTVDVGSEHFRDAVDDAVVVDLHGCSCGGGLLRVALCSALRGGLLRSTPALGLGLRLVFVAGLVFL